MFDKIKNLSKDTLIYGTSTIVGRFLNFLLVPLYTNIFLPGEFGIVANVYAYIAILNVFFTIGLESGYFKFASTNEIGTKKQNFSHPYILIFINSLILSSVLFLFAKQFTYIFQISEDKYYLLHYTALILFFDAVVIVPFAYLRLQNKPKIFALVKMTFILVNVTSNFILIIYLRWGIVSIFIGNLIASVLTFILLSGLVIKNIEISFNKILFIELMKFSLPFIPAGISSNIVQVINRPILKYLTDDSTVGIFQANYKLGIFMMLFVSMFEFAWRPFFLQNAEEPNAKTIYSKVMTFFVLASSVLFLFLSLFIDNIAKMHIPFKGFLIGKAYWGGLNIVPVILFSYLLYGIYINLMAGIYIQKKTKYLPFITGGAAIINVIFNFLLIPHYHMMGAAIATLLSYLTMMVGIFYVSNKYYRINYEYKKIFFIILLLLIIYAGYLTINYYSIIVWYNKILFLILFAGSLFIFKIFNFSSIKDIILKKN